MCEAEVWIWTGPGRPVTPRYEYHSRPNFTPTCPPDARIIRCSWYPDMLGAHDMRIWTQQYTCIMLEVAFYSSDKRHCKCFKRQTCFCSTFDTHINMQEILRLKFHDKVLSQLAFVPFSTGVACITWPATLPPSLCLCATLPLSDPPDNSHLLSQRPQRTENFDMKSHSGSGRDLETILQRSERA